MSAAFSNSSSNRGTGETGRDQRKRERERGMPFCEIRETDSKLDRVEEDGFLVDSR